jgi:hypothetical protein
MDCIEGAKHGSLSLLVDLINKNGLLIQMDVVQTSETTYKFKAYYSNKSTAPMDKMTLLLAAPKVKKLRWLLGNTVKKKIKLILFYSP